MSAPSRSLTIIEQTSPCAERALASSRVAKNSARLRSRSSHRDNASCTASSTRWLGRLDDVGYYVAKESGSFEVANRLIDSIPDRF